MASRAETNSFFPEDNNNVETPRLPFAILTARNSAQRIIQERTDDPIYGKEKALRLLHTLNKPAAELYLLCELEQGKEEGLNFALGRRTGIESRISIVDEIADEEIFSQEEPLTYTLKSSSELMRAKRIQGEIVDELFVAKHLKGIDSYTFLNDDDDHGGELLDSATIFSHNLGILQSLNYVLGRDNDGGMAELVEEHKGKITIFKRKLHP